MSHTIEDAIAFYEANFDALAQSALKTATTASTTLNSVTIPMDEVTRVQIGIGLASLAQATATLAVAEQLRIANALAREHDR